MAHRINHPSPVFELKSLLKPGKQSPHHFLHGEGPGMARAHAGSLGSSFLEPGSWCLVRTTILLPLIIFTFPITAIASRDTPEHEWHTVMTSFF